MRRPKVLLAAAGTVGLAGLAAAGVLFWADETAPPSAEVAATCENAVSMYFAHDADMLGAAITLGADKRIGDVLIEAVPTARARLKAELPDFAWLAEDPEMHFAAAVHLAAADGVDRAKLTEHLGEKFTLTTAVTTPTVCHTSPTMATELAAFVDDSVKCGRFTVFFDSDADMSAAETSMREDDLVREVEATTEAEATEHGEELFADDPDMLELIETDGLPPSIDFTVAPGVSTAELKGELTKNLDGLDKTYEPPCHGMRHPVAVPDPAESSDQ